MFLGAECSKFCIPCTCASKSRAQRRAVFAWRARNQQQSQCIAGSGLQGCCSAPGMVMLVDKPMTAPVSWLPFHTKSVVGRQLPGDVYPGFHATE